MIVGYVRWSRDEDREQQTQHDLTIRDIDLLFEDTGRSHAGLKQAFKSLRMGDVLVTCSLSQFSLGIGDLLKLVGELRYRGCHLAVLDLGPLDTRSREGWSFFQHCAALVTMEKQLTRSHANAELISIGPPRGKNGGRPKKMTADQVEQARRALLLRSGRTSLKDVAKDFNVSLSSLYRNVINDEAVQARSYSLD